MYPEESPRNLHCVRRSQEEAARVQQARDRAEADLRHVSRQHKEALDLKVGRRASHVNEHPRLHRMQQTGCPASGRARKLITDAYIPLR